MLDLRLPDIEGYEVVRRLRAAKVQTPVLILSGRSDPTDKVRGLIGGADDYLTKPFNKAELVARIQAIVRRSKGHAESVIRTGKLLVNMDARSVEADGRRLHVTGKEYSILELLSLRKGTTLTKEMFLDHLYGGMDEPELKIIDVFICKLRKKLAEATGGEHYIETVWGRGYVLKDPEPVEQRRCQRPPSPEARDHPAPLPATGRPCEQSQALVMTASVSARRDSLAVGRRRDQFWHCAAAVVVHSRALGRRCGDQPASGRFCAQHRDGRRSAALRSSRLAAGRRGLRRGYPAHRPGLARC